MVYSETTNRTGLIQLLEDMTVTQSGTGASYLLAAKTRDLNSSLAYFMMLAMKAAGRTQVDDSNQAKYPIITFNLVSGQQEYVFVNDNETTPNQILDLLRVEAATSADASPTWAKLEPYDMTETGESITQRANYSGVPTSYDIYGNAIWLDYKPNYAATAGLKLYINRTPTYFTTSDTTKVPGIPWMFHEYLAIRCAYLFWLRNDQSQANAYLNTMMTMEKAINEYYAGRNKDDRKVATVEGINFR
jgi:hypothetical protein